MSSNKAFYSFEDIIILIFVIGVTKTYKYLDFEKSIKIYNIIVLERGLYHIKLGISN